MAPITQIRAHVETADVGGAGSDSWTYLGVGGREFLLDLQGRSDTGRAADDTYYFGEGTNVENAEYNDPRTPRLDTDDLIHFPVYLRVETSGSEPPWCIEMVSVTVNPESRDARQYTHPALRPHSERGRIWLDDKSGKALYLRPVGSLHAD